MGNPWPWKPRTFLWKAERLRSDLTHAALSNAWHFTNVCVLVASSVADSQVPFGSDMLYLLTALGFMERRTFS